MKEAHDKGFTVEWTSHRGGSKVLTEAMKLLAQRQINLGSKQQIFLSDHTSSQYEADILRRKIGMNTGAAKWHNATLGVAQLIGGKRLGTVDLSISVNAFQHTAKGKRPGQVVDAAWQGAKLYKKSVAKGTSAIGVATTLSATTGISFTMAQALCGLLVGGAACTALASMPSLNEGYYKGAAEPGKLLANKLFARK